MQDEYQRMLDHQRNTILAGYANMEAGQISQQPKEPVGPDIEIEQYHRMFEADQKINPHHEICFEKFIEMNAVAKSNAWAYEANRKGTNLISF